MKFPPTWALFLGFATQAAFADVIVVLPTDEVTTGFSIPIVVKSTGGEFSGSELKISGRSGDYLKLKFDVNTPVSSISTRFRGVDDQVEVQVLTHDGKKQTQTHQLKFKAPAVVPTDSGDVQSLIGSTTFTFTQGSVSTELREQKGRAIVLVKNAASQKHFVESLRLELGTTGGVSYATVYGSPYWFEPLIVFSGDFLNAKVLEVKSK